MGCVEGPKESRSPGTLLWVNATQVVMCKGVAAAAGGVVAAAADSVNL